jgi:hypothetical protein
MQNPNKPSIIPLFVALLFLSSVAQFATPSSDIFPMIVFMILGLFVYNRRRFEEWVITHSTIMTLLLLVVIVALPGAPLAHFIPTKEKLIQICHVSWRTTTMLYKLTLQFSRQLVNVFSS